MYALESYRDLIDLSVPAAPRASRSQKPDVVALEWLFAEHHRDAEDVEIPTAVSSAENSESCHS